ncbi:MAG: flotillin family protein [Clostridia bacterium]|nr:flotillin family protein [Clostridia bacterium]
MEMVLQFLMEKWWLILVCIVGLIVLIRLVPRYKIAPPDTALIISGLLRRSYKVRNPDGTVSAKKFGYRIVRGGATFYIPAIERIDQLDMCLMQVDIKTAQPVPTKEYISVLVDAVANIKIGSDDLSIATAAEQLLHYDADQIKSLAKDVLEGNMREIIGQMTIAELVQNRDKFAQESIKAAMSDMSNMGLEIINLTIQNFSDKDGQVIETMATQKIVEKERDASIARAKAQQEGHKAEIEAQAAIAEQDKELALLKAAYQIESDQEKAKADEAYRIEQERVRKTFEQERAAAELTRLEKETELKKQEVEIQRERLNVEIREKAAAEKDARQFQAEAEKFERQAQADAQLYEAQKEAEAIRMKGEAEAEAIRMKAEAMKLYGQAAMLEMVVDKLPEIAQSVSEPLSKTEKIILFGEGGATSMARDTAGTMLQTFEAVKQAVGLDIPKMLRDVSVGGLVGKAAAEDNTDSKDQKEE